MWQTYCHEHRMPELHKCPPLMAAKHVEKYWLKRESLSIASGMFAAVCYQDGYTSEYTDILAADKMRDYHVKADGCSPEKVWPGRIEDEEPRRD